MGQGTRSRLVRRDVLELQTPQFYFAPGDTNVFTGPLWRTDLLHHCRRRTWPSLASLRFPRFLQWPGRCPEYFGYAHFQPGHSDFGAELGMASALGFVGNNGNHANLDFQKNLSQSEMQLIARLEFSAIANVTAYWLREGTSNGFALAPSQHYGTSTYSRDSFWTTYGLQGTPFQAETETTIFDQFTNAIPTSGSDAGHVPVTSGVQGDNQ